MSSFICSRLFSRLACAADREDTFCSSNIFSLSSDAISSRALSSSPLARARSAPACLYLVSVSFSRLSESRSLDSTLASSCKARDRSCDTRSSSRLAASNFDSRASYSSATSLTRADKTSTSALLASRSLLAVASESWSSRISKRAILTFSEARERTKRVHPAMITPVMMVITIEVYLGLSPKIERRFRPTFMPMRSPT
jgi:hypothetical protein